MSPDVSVVVCTYNRADLLRDTLESLCSQDCDQSRYEVLVVDNNSTDSTKDTAQSFMRYGNVRYVFEPRQGLSCARNRGLHEAHSDYVAFIDDDAVAPPSWLTTAFRVVSRWRPAAFGGPYYPRYIRPKPRWFRDAYASQGLGDTAKHIEGPGLSGGNIFFRREVLERMGGFDESLGMKGSQLGYGEETAVLKRLGTDFPDETVYYEPELAVLHLVKPQRMSLRWSVKHNFIAGGYSFRFLGPGQGALESRFAIVLRDAGRVLCALLLETLRAVTARDKNRYPHIENALYERCLPQVRRLGWLSAQLQIKLR